MHIKNIILRKTILLCSLVFTVLYLVEYFLIFYIHNTEIGDPRGFSFSELKDELLCTETTVITLFTTFKEHENRNSVHSLVVKNWASLMPHVRPVLFTTFAKCCLCGGSKA